MVVTAKRLVPIRATARPAEGLRPILVQLLVAAIEFRLELLLRFAGLVCVAIAPPELLVSRTRFLGDEFESAFVFADIFASAVCVDPGCGQFLLGRGKSGGMERRRRERRLLSGR